MSYDAPYWKRHLMASGCLSIIHSGSLVLSAWCCCITIGRQEKERDPLLPRGYSK